MLVTLHMYVYINTHTRTRLERLTCTVLVTVGWTILVCVGDASRTVCGACKTAQNKHIADVATQNSGFLGTDADDQMRFAFCLLWNL